MTRLMRWWRTFSRWVVGPVMPEPLNGSWKSLKKDGVKQAKRRKKA